MVFWSVLAWLGFAHATDRLRITGGSALVGQIVAQNPDHYIFVPAGSSLTNTILKEDVEGIELDFDQDKYLLRALKITNELERIPWLERSLKTRGASPQVLSMLASLYLKYQKQDKYNQLKESHPADFFATLDAWKAVARGADPTEVLRSRATYSLSDDERIIAELLSVRWWAKSREPEKALSALDSLENIFGPKVALQWKALDKEEPYADLRKRLLRMSRYKESVSQFRNAMAGLDGMQEPPAVPSGPVRGFRLHFNVPPPFLQRP